MEKLVRLVELQAYHCFKITDNNGFEEILAKLSTVRPNRKEVVHIFHKNGFWVRSVYYGLTNSNFWSSHYI